MKNTTMITVLPIGELDTDLIRSEFAAIVGVFKQLGASLALADPVADDEGVRRFGQKMPEYNPDLLLMITLRGHSAPIIETAARVSHAPCLLWPVQGRFALPSSTLAIGALRESGFPVELIYAPPDQPDSIKRIQCIMRAARAYSRIRKSRIGVIGGLFPNLVSCRYDPQTVSLRLGTTIVPISFNDVRDSLQSLTNRSWEIEQYRQEIISTYTVNTASINILDEGIKLHLALKSIALEKQIDGFAVECWSGFPVELGLNPCLGFIEDAYTLACEGDVMLCISLLIVRYLTGSSVYVGDLYDVSLDGVLTLIHCGAPASLASHKKGVELVKSQLAFERGFETMTCRPLLDPGLVTMFRFYGRDCDKMHVALGELASCERASKLMVKVRLAGNRDDFLSECFGNHYIVVAGDIRKELWLLGKLLGITIFNT